LQPLIIAVQENETFLDDTPEKLGIEAVCIREFLKACLAESHFAAISVGRQTIFFLKY